MQNSVGTIAGQIGSGKTTLVKDVIRDRLAREPRVLVIDALAEYGADVGCEVLWIRNEGDMNRALDRLAAIGERDRYALSVRCERDEDALDIIRMSYELPRSLVVLEEASLYCAPGSLPRDVARLIRFGRHRELDLIFVTRRPSELHRDATAQSHWFVTFRQVEPRDIQYLQARVGREAAERAMTLPPFRVVLATQDPNRVPIPILIRATESGSCSIEARPEPELTGDELDEPEISDQGETQETA